MICLEGSNLACPQKQNTSHLPGDVVYVPADKGNSFGLPALSAGCNSDSVQRNTASGHCISRICIPQPVNRQHSKDIRTAPQKGINAVQTGWIVEAFFSGNFLRSLDFLRCTAPVRLLSTNLSAGPFKFNIITDFTNTSCKCTSLSPAPSLTLLKVTCLHHAQDMQSISPSIIQTLWSWNPSRGACGILS